VHHSKAVIQWLQNRESLIELGCLPANRPEPNPDELFNSEVKANVHRRAMPRDKDELKKQC
jgi:hypothetical protein